MGLESGQGRESEAVPPHKILIKKMVRRPVDPSLPNVPVAERFNTLDEKLKEIDAINYCGYDPNKANKMFVIPVAQTKITSFYELHKNLANTKAKALLEDYCVWNTPCTKNESERGSYFLKNYKIKLPDGEEKITDGIYSLPSPTITFYPYKFKKLWNGEQLVSFAGVATGHAKEFLSKTEKVLEELVNKKDINDLICNWIGFVQDMDSRVYGSDKLLDDKLDKEEYILFVPVMRFNIELYFKKQERSLTNIERDTWLKRRDYSAKYTIMELSKRYNAEVFVLPFEQKELSEVYLSVNEADKKTWDSTTPILSKDVKGQKKVLRDGVVWSLEEEQDTTAYVDTSRVSKKE